jgi:hypothetical protein
VVEVEDSADSVTESDEEMEKRANMEDSNPDEFFET